MINEAISLNRRLVDMLADGELDLPRFGEGHSRERLSGLWYFGAEDVALAKLAESHADAVAILVEAGCDVPPGALLAVWASEGRHATLAGRPSARGWRLKGTKPFCSGAEMVDAAIVTVTTETGGRLFLLPVDDRVLVSDRTWATAGMASTATVTVTVDSELDESAMVGEADFYLTRPSFWHGAIGVAACWAGGASVIAGAVTKAAHDDDPLWAAAIGRCEVAVATMRAVLTVAADEIDADPDDKEHAAHRRALAVREQVVTCCEAIIAAAHRATGPRLLVTDASVSRRLADLTVFLRQHHGDHDLAALGSLAIKQI